MDDTQPADIFLWANATDAKKNDLAVEFFLFNKNYTLFSMNYASDIVSQIKPLFLYDYMNFVTLEAGTGLSVRDYEQNDAEDGVLLRTELSKVGKAATLLHQIEKERQDIVMFSDEEHDFKRIKGIIAKFTGPDKKSFYIVKAIQQSSALKGTTSWEFRDGKFGLFQADVAVKMPSDNQVLIVEDDIFIFNQRKFETLFQYEYKKQLLADQKVAEIEKQYKLSFPDGLDFQSLVKEQKRTVTKLQKLEVGDISQEQAIEHADTMQLELMVDDDGAIIIMDGKDLDMFVNLINEDYITSQVTGKRYEIKNKKLLDEPEGEPPRG